MSTLTLARVAAISAAVSVMAGAFAAHGAAGQAAQWLKTGGEYELIHAVGVLVALHMRVRSAAMLLLGGSILFAATLYAMAFGGPTWLGAVTPLGGLAMIAGWLVLAWRLAVPLDPAR